MVDIFLVWQKEAEKLANGEITKVNYDNWQYIYPKEEAKRTKDALDKCHKERKSNQQQKENKQKNLTDSLKSVRFI